MTLVSRTKATCSPQVDRALQIGSGRDIEFDTTTSLDSRAKAIETRPLPTDPSRDNRPRFCLHGDSVIARSLLKAPFDALIEVADKQLRHVSHLP